MSTAQSRVLMSLSPKSPRALAAFLRFLREHRTKNKATGRAFVIEAFGPEIGYAKSTVGNLESETFLRTEYHHIERYADHFGVPSGIILLITRVASKIRDAENARCPARERQKLLREVQALAAGIDALAEAIGHDAQAAEVSTDGGSSLGQFIDATTENPRRACYPLFEHLLAAFERGAGGCGKFKDSARGRRA